MSTKKATGARRAEGPGGSCFICDRRVEPKLGDMCLACREAFEAAEARIESSHRVGIDRAFRAQQMQRWIAQRVWRFARKYLGRKRSVAQGKIVESRTQKMLRKQAKGAVALAKEFGIEHDQGRIDAIIKSWGIDG